MSSPLSSLLSSPTRAEAFEDYLEHIGHGNSLRFLWAVEGLKKCPSSQHAQMVRSIQDNLLNNLNYLPAEVMELISITPCEPNSTFFDPAYVLVVQHLNNLLEDFKGEAGEQCIGSSDVLEDIGEAAAYPAAASSPPLPIVTKAAAAGPPITKRSSKNTTSTKLSLTKQSLNLTEDLRVSKVGGNKNISSGSKVYEMNYDPSFCLVSTVDSEVASFSSGISQDDDSVIGSRKHGNYKNAHANRHAKAHHHSSQHHHSNRSSKGNNQIDLNKIPLIPDPMKNIDVPLYMPDLRDKLISKENTDTILNPKVFLELVDKLNQIPLDVESRQKLFDERRKRFDYNIEPRKITEHKKNVLEFNKKKDLAQELANKLSRLDDSNGCPEDILDLHVDHVWRDPTPKSHSPKLGIASGDGRSRKPAGSGGAQLPQQQQLSHGYSATTVDSGCPIDWSRSSSSKKIGSRRGNGRNVDAYDSGMGSQFTLPITGGSGRGNGGASGGGRRTERVPVTTVESTPSSRSRPSTSSRPATTLAETHQPVSSQSTIPVYLFYEGTKVPYGLKLPSTIPLTLAILKNHLPKKGNWQYFCNCNKDEASVNSRYEIKDDSEILPILDGKIVVHLTRIF